MAEELAVGGGDADVEVLDEDQDWLAVVAAADAEAAGFPLREAERALNTVSAYVAGIALSEAALQGLLARHGQSPQDWLDELMSVADDVTEGHERLRTITTGYAGKDPQQEVDEDFEYGLERVLDGLQARLDAST